jgi:hypothetical protein
MILPDYRQRAALRRWKRQREREQLLQYVQDLPRDLPLPGRPWWRVKWRAAGLDVSKLPFNRGYGPLPGSDKPRTYADIAAMTDARRERRHAAKRNRS